MNFDQMFHTKKQNKETCSVSPKSQYFKSEYSPFRSPESQTQSTRSKSNLRNSRIDLLYDLENYNGPKLSLDKDVAINEFCIDHPDKKSKFYITNGIFSKDFGDSKLNRGFCSKCSVQVAMKGFTLEEVIKEDEFDRKIRIDNFLEFLNTTEEKEVRRLQNIISAMNGTSSYLNNQIKRMEQAFAGVFKSLELKRKKVMGELKANQKHNKNCFAELSELINVKLKTIDAMKKDIDSNLDKIISRIDKEPFNQIITNYELNILNLESQILEAGQLKGLTFASEDGKDKLARLVNDLFQLKSFKIVEIKKDFQPVIEILGELEPFSSFDKRDAGSFLINDQKGSCENSSRSGDEENEGTFSQNVPSRITMQRDESSFSKSHQFNYQLYKQSPKNQTENSHKSISGAVTSIIHNNIREGKDQFLQNQAGGNRKRIKGKSAATLSFDNRHIVTLHKKASDIEDEREKWRIMRENRQFMSMKNNAYSNGDTDQPPQNLHNLDSIFLHRDNPPIDRNSNRMTQSYIHPNPSPDVPIVPATLMNNNESSIQSATTEQDTTIKYISILDKINDNQMKKNKFYSDIIKDIDDPQDSSSSHLEELDSPHRMIRDEEFRSEGRNWGKSKDRHRESRGEMTGSEENGNNNNIDHILEIHQPNHNEIIFECSKEWTVNQTPDMREKDSIPLHIQQHLDKMRPIGSTLSGLGIGGRQLEFLDTCDERQSGSNQKRGRAQAEKSGVSSSVDRGDNNSSMYRSRAHRLNCQKELFGSK